CCLLSGCRTTPTDQSDVKIIGGTEAAPNSVYARSTVAIAVTNVDGTMGLCSGTLIQKRLVVTAAHCFNKAVGPTQKNVVIFHPDTSKAQESEAVLAEATWRHKNFSHLQIAPT